MVLIDRQVLIDEIAKTAKRLDNLDTINGLCGAVAVAMELPTIDTDNDDDIYDNDVCVFCGKLKNFEEYGLVEQKVGKWMEVNCWCRCSECLEDAGKKEDDSVWLSEFCPHCGAKMEGVEYET